jgi:hypothetical protein
MSLMAEKTLPYPLQIFSSRMPTFYKRYAIMLNVLVFGNILWLTLHTYVQYSKISNATNDADTGGKEEAILEDNWISLASVIEEQHELLSESVQKHYDSS